MASSQNKLQKDRNQKVLLELASQPGNNICADCKTRLPRWASHSIGIFICVNCASIHRKMGVHISKVKSLTMDDWTKEQIEFMKSMGNERSNSIYNPNELRNPPPPDIENNERDSEIEQYIRSKYEYKKFMDKSALVASKLGPSRSASSVTPRSVPSSSSQTAATSQSSSNTRSAATGSAPPFSFASSLPSTSTNSIPRPTQPWSIPPSIPSQSSLTVQQQKDLNSRNDLQSMLDDLNAMIGPEKDSSLPLQYKKPTAHSQPHINGAIGAQGYPVGVTSAGMGMNPFAKQQLGINPFSQQQSSSPFAPPPYVPQQNTQPVPAAAANPNPQSFASNQSYGLQSQQMGTTGYSQPVVSQQQPQSSMQTQSTSFIPTSSSQGFLSPSSSNPSQFLSPSTGTSSQFLSSSPSGSQFLSSSPSAQYLSSSPSQQQQQFGSHSPQPQMQGQMGFQSPMSQPTGQFGGSNNQSFLGMTTMQMQQQLLLQQQQQQQQQRQQQQQQQEAQRQQQMQMQLQLQQQHQQQQQQMQMQSLLQQQQQAQQQAQQQFAQQGMYGSNQQQMYSQMFPQGGGGFNSGQGQGGWGGM